MLGFDVLDPALDLKRSYFLEASAGTGKTFTIENIVVRLIEEGIPIERILVVTFTRAATIELKRRIRRNLEERQLKKALSNFDEAKIFTIHSFCFHTLQESALETGFPINQIEESASPDTLKRIFKDFLRTGLTPEEIHPKQLEKVLKKHHNDLERLLNELYRPSSDSGRSFEEIYQEILLEVKRLDLEREPLLDELLALAPSFSGMCDRQRRLKSENEEGIRHFASLFKGEAKELIDLPILKMVPQNLLKGKNYPERLQQLHTSLIPLLAELSNTAKIQSRLSSRAQEFLAHVSSQEDLFFYDDLIKHMQINVRNELFAEKTRSHYSAVLIDEFQDTDRVQWEIFSTLFLDRLPLYLVGDPKQSIYRFRGADLYAYMEAKEALGENAVRTLTRNFRSYPALIQGLNTLFNRVPDLITLPKIGKTLSIPPVIAALPESNEGHIVFCASPDESALFSYCISEIERLHQTEGLPYHKCAILVKDRHQAKRFSHQCSLPFATKRNESLLDSEAFPILEDLLRAAYNPRDRHAIAKVLGGPLFGLTLEQLGAGFEERVEPFYRYNNLLATQGILIFFKAVLAEGQMPCESLYHPLLQLVELIAETTRGIEEILPFMEKLKQEDPESERLKARAVSMGDAIQIMTLHVSKGLEFDAVFPVGLICPSDMEEEEDLSEKMRQLYVALTRAKKRLYIPLSDKQNTPIHVFLSKVLQGESLECFIKGHPYFSLALCEKQTPLLPPLKPSSPKEFSPRNETPLTFPPCALYSYTSLSKKNENMTSYSALPEGEMPAGVETGILLHHIFERLDFKKSGRELRAFLVQQLKGKHLEPWLSSVEILVENALHFPLQGLQSPFCLADLDAKKILREMEFMYATEEPAGYLKGFIDLFFEHQGYYYIIDWKSNFLENYTPEKIEETIDFHDYALQAELYQTAALKYLKLFNQEHLFGGSFYMFLRGLNPITQTGVHHFRST